MGNICVNTHSTFIENIYMRNVECMDRYEKRRLQLKEVVEAAGRGGISKIAKQCDIDSTYMSRLLYPEGKAGKKRIGEDIVEKIVFALGDIFDETKKTNPPELVSSEVSIEIPLLNVTASMGNGQNQNGHEIVIDVLRVCKSWTASK